MASANANNKMQIVDLMPIVNSKTRGGLVSSKVPQQQQQQHDQQQPPGGGGPLSTIL